MDYDTLVLSGGSTKGIVTLGSLQYIHDSGLLKHINTFIGTSAGSMICYLLAIGYTPIEIIVWICTHQLLEKLRHFNIVAMINGTGAASFNEIQEQLEKMTIAKIGYLPNFSDIKNKYDKVLICVTHNDTKQQTEYLGPFTTPTLPCITGLRMSASLPLIFEKYKYGDSYYIDGSISDNFAIQLGDEMGKKVLGILVDTEKENFNNDGETSILETIYRMMFIPISQATEYKIAKCSEKCNIIRLNYGKLKVFNFNINSTEKLEMFSAGYQQCEQNIIV
jgi:predicted acylesterase/phospholipase RssA